eukprot:g11888.t1
MKKASPYGVISEKTEDDNNDRSIEIIELGGTSDGLNNRMKNEDGDYKNVKYTSGENKKRPTYETRAIKRFFVYIYAFPKCLEFDDDEKYLAKICRVVQSISCLLLIGPTMFCIFFSIGLETVFCVILGLIGFTGYLYQHSKVSAQLVHTMDMDVILHDPELCKQFHDKVKRFDVPLFKLFLKDFLNPSTYVMVGYPIYVFIRDKYWGFLAICIVFTLFGFLNQCQRVGLDIARKIIYERNEIEIKEYLKSIENIVLNNAANDNKDEEEAATAMSAVDIKSIMRKKQKHFERSMIARKRSLVYLPLDVLIRSLTVIFLVTVLMLRPVTDDVPLNIATFIIVLLFVFAFFLNLKSAFKMLSQSPNLFEQGKRELEVIDFMHAVESNLGMRYEIFDQWLNKQKQIATIHVLGFPINGELVKRMLFALTSVISILFFYVGRSLINPNDMF